MPTSTTDKEKTAPCGARRALTPFLIAAALLVSPVLLTACEAMPEYSSPMPSHGGVKTPRGFTAYCTRNPGECSELVLQPEEVDLTPERYEELSRVHRDVNRSIKYVSDRSLYGRSDYWTLPDGRGDCEDIALEKRRRLIALGWPRHALLLTVAKLPDGTGHLVLTVTTKQGDYVLDNLQQTVRPWTRLNYRWLTRQSRWRETRWVRLLKRVKTR